MSDNYEKDMALTLEEALEIVKSLHEYRLEISRGHEKTELFILNTDLEKEDIVKIIKSLNSEDYVKGPIPDDKPNLNRHKPVWIFKKNWQEIRLYIKIKIFITTKKIYLLSIHEDEEDNSNA